jgi:photosystem II stability/assembly factor-like uncharacterized protein
MKTAIIKPQLILIFAFMVQIVFSQLNVSSWRQIENNPNLLKTLQEPYEQFYAQKYQDSLHPEFKAYNRYLRYWNDRLGVDSNGELSYTPYFQAALSNASNSICTGDDPADWQLMGPSYHPEKQQQGLFTEVLYDDAYPDKLLISSNHGGLWKFNPNTNKWYCVTDDIRFPGLSANDLMRHPFDSDIIFAATGNGLWHTKYGMGLLVSNDRGETWTIMQSYLDHVNNEFPRLRRVLADPIDNNPNDGLTLYLAGPKQVYRANYTSTQQTWQTISPALNLPNGEEILDMEIMPNGDIVVGTEYDWSYNAHAYKYHNGQWSEIIIESNITPQRVRFTTPVGDDVFALKDNMQILNGDTTYFRSIYKSTNGGGSWTLLRKNLQGPQPKAEIEYSPNSGLYISASLGVYLISSSTGNVLHYFYDDYNVMHADIRDICIVGIENGIDKTLFATDGGITRADVILNNYSESTLNNLNAEYLPCNNVIGLAVSNSGTKAWFTSAVYQGTYFFNNTQLITNINGDGEDGVYNPEDSQIYYKNGNGTIERINEDNTDIVHYDNNYRNGGFINMRMEISPNNSNILYFGLKYHRLGIYNDITTQTTYSNTITAQGDILKKVGPIAISKNSDIYIADYSRKEHDISAKFMVSFDNADTWIDKSFGLVYENINGQWESTTNLSAMLDWKRINAIITNPDNNNELWIGIGSIGQAGKLKVLHSTDKGESWYDYSEGLTAMPITDFLYHWETETLFVGTDVGVFYRHPFNTQNESWECFSNGLPVAAITEMDYNSCSNELFVSMQGRSVFATPIPFEIINSENENYENDETIYGTVVWNSPHYFDGDVTIAPNASLTINANCRFSSDNRIIVLPGGSLTVNAKLGVLECTSGPWQGIQVVGNSNMPQEPIYQGIVYLGEDAIIQEAKIAIATYQFDAQGNEIENSYGGIIKANGATFINNGIGCEIKHYYSPNPPLSWQQEIKNCDFYTNGGYYGLFDPYAQTPVGVQIINNSRVKIENNTFTSADELLLDYWSSFPIGIQKYNSSSEIKNNTFDRLSYGVYCRDYYPGTGIDIIANNTFNVNYFGLYENGVTGSQVYNNQFDNDISYHLPHNNASENIIGVYKNACSNYLIEDNDFDGNHAQHEQTNIGLLINNGGSNNQVIYKNDFQGFDYAILAQGNNRSLDGTTGLSFKCNDLTFEKNDISVSFKEGTINPGIATAQGSPASGNESAAGNLFNKLAWHESHFWNISSLNATVTYYHHISDDDDDYDRLVPGYIDPSLINGVMVTPNLLSSWDDSPNGSCPSHLPDDWGDIKGRMEDAGEEIDIYKQSLAQLVDAGNTNQMNADVNTSESSEAYALRNDLLNSSPYLSNEVLQSATDKEEVLTNPLIRDVLVANPQAAKDAEVLDMIENRQNPMPDYMKTQIINGQSIISAKEQMEGKLHHQQLKYNNALSRLTAQCLTDTTGTYTIDTLTLLLSSAKSIEARYHLAGIYYHMGNFTEMNNTLGAINTDFVLDSYHTQELNELASYYDLLSVLKTEERTPFEMTEAEISSLTSLYENSTNKAAVYARNILLYAGIIEYEAPVILPDMSMKSSLIDWQATPQAANTPKAQLNIYPNPAREYIVLDYDITGDFQKASILIYQSAKGNLIKQQELFGSQNAVVIDIANLLSGVYLATLQIDGYAIETVKFTISH